MADSKNVSGGDKSSSKAQSLLPGKRASLARKIMRDDLAPALMVYKAADYLMEGPSGAIDAWEPETIWAELHRMGIPCSEVQHNKVLAIIALKTGPDVIVSANVIQNIALALSNEIPHIDIEEEVDAEHLAWMVKFMQDYFPDRSFFLDYEPVEFIAHTLHDEGYFTAPPELAFAQERLDAKNQNKADYSSMLVDIKDGKAGVVTAISMEQQEKLKRVKLFVEVMNDALKKSMRDFK